MIVVENVSKYYGDHPAVRDLSFRIEDGECVGFLGLNGAGKTTTLRLLSCLTLPTSGRIRIRDLDVEQTPHSIRSFIGFLPDTPPLYPEMTVSDFLVFAGRLRGMTGAELRKRLPEVYETCGLGDVKELPINTLSHGYRQRAGIAQAIVHEPALLILDEPIQGLDPVQIVEMREMIRRLRGKHTILLSTHILSEIQQTCDRILILNEGRIAAEGSEEELLRVHSGSMTIEAEIRFGSSDEIDLSGACEKIEGLFEGSPELEAPQLTELSTDLFSLRIACNGDHRARVAATLVGAGIELLRLDRETSALEAMFVELSGPAQRTSAQEESS